MGIESAIVNNQPSTCWPREVYGGKPEFTRAQLCQALANIKERDKQPFASVRASSQFFYTVLSENKSSIADPEDIKALSPKNKYYKNKEHIRSAIAGMDHPYLMVRLLRRDVSDVYRTQHIDGSQWRFLHDHCRVLIWDIYWQLRNRSPSKTELSRVFYIADHSTDESDRGKWKRNHMDYYYEYVYQQAESYTIMVHCALQSLGKKGLTVTD